MDLAQPPQAPIGSPPNTAYVAPMINGGVNLAPGSGASFSLAPGGERSSGGAPGPERTVVMDYKTDFPELPPTQMQKQTGNQKGPATAWAKPLPKFKSTQVTQVFHLPPEERSHKDFGAQQFGDKSQEQQKCNEIATATGCTIELCESRDLTLTILMTGKRPNVEEARKRIVQELQMQASKEIRIPKEHHRVLIGREGKRLRDLETESDCRIMVPGRDMPSDVVKVIGPKEGIDKALHQIQLISDEQSKLAQEHMVIPRVFYPWIRGPFNESIDRIQSETGARVNIPPPAANSEVIVVTGEKEGVYRAVKMIKDIYDDKQSVCKAVTCKVSKAQHRYVIGPQRSGLAEILKETGVSVEIPPEEEDSDTITLRGHPDQLGIALTMVYQKASSVVTAEIECPVWLHKFIIGPRGQTLKQLIGDESKVHVEFEDSGTIYLQGPPEAVKSARSILDAKATSLKAEMSVQLLKVHPSYHRHVIGRQGSNISKMKQEHGVIISIPDESTNSDEIRVEGKKEGVTKTSGEIMEIVKRLENEKTRDIIIEQRFHKQLIGSKGDNINAIKEQFSGVQFSFPEPGRKSEVVTLRGPKDEVDKCYKYLQNTVKELQENNFQVRVPIFKDFHKNIIGKGGATVKKIREETGTRIDLPAENSGEDTITVTGKKANVEKAAATLQKIQNELASIVTIEMKIPSKIQPRLYGGGGRLINDIADQCGGVHIKFPSDKAPSDKVTIRGPKDDAEKAQKLLADLAKDRELSSFEDSITAKQELHRFLIGKGGSNIKKVREIAPDVRILFPRLHDTEQETIHLIGRKEEVAKIKEQIEKQLVELRKTVEVIMEVEPKWHRHFVMRGAQVLREVQDQFGVIISFPRPGTNESNVSIKGGKECCDQAKGRIEEIVEDLEATITTNVEIAQEHHRMLLANRGARVQEICAKYKVQIKFPEREQKPVQNGDGPHHSNDQIVVTGRPENCDGAAEELKALIPITEKVSVPHEKHGSLIGKGGSEIRRLIAEFDVQISIPPPSERRDIIEVRGPASNVAPAVEEIERLRDVLLAKSFELAVQVPPEYHVRLIGPRGQYINQLRNRFDVEISIPDPKKDPDNVDRVIITGLEESANACKDEIERVISDIQSLFTQEITLDCRVHPRVIGKKGATVRRMMDDYGVEIRFPRQNDPDPSLVTIAGKSEDSVYDCVDQLRIMEEEFLQDMIDRHAPPAREPVSPFQGLDSRQSGISVAGAPWQAESPDVDDMSQFPSMGGEMAPSAPAMTSVWGRRGAH